jgi:hypothetical protein
MQYLFLAILVLMMGAFVLGGVGIFIEGLRELKSWRGPVTIVAAILFLVGTAGFFGSALSAMGGLDWLGSFEWPIGYTSDVVRLADGRYVVPHTPTGRVQVYDPNLRFQRGWRINASGGTFSLRTTAEGNIEIYTAHGSRRLLYEPSGRLVTDSKYVRDPMGRELDPPAEAIGVMIPTRWWLWPLTGPFYAWFCLVVGMLLFGELDRHKKRQHRSTRRSRGDR